MKSERRLRLAVLDEFPSTAMTTLIIRSWKFPPFRDPNLIDAEHYNRNADGIPVACQLVQPGDRASSGTRRVR